MKKTFDILGLSASLASMLSDLLVKIYGINITIRLVRNVKAKDDIPFKIDGVNYIDLYHDEWQLPSKNILIGVYRVKSKKEVYEFFKNKYSIDFNSYINIIHPKTDLALTARLGKGIFCNAFVSLASFTSIGNLVTINRHVSIGHHTNISDFCVLNPAVHVAGFCNIGKGVTLGLGTKIIDGITIGENTIIGAGSLVTKDIPENVVAYGSPAKVIKDNKF